MIRNLIAVIPNTLKLEGSCQGSPELFMGLRMVAAIDCAHSLGRQLKLTDQIGRLALSLHKATAAWLHLTHKPLPLFLHPVSASGQRVEIL
jgi:hypothetical protein